MECRVADCPGAAVAVEFTVRDGGPAVKAKLLKEAARFQRRVSSTTDRTVGRVYRPALVGLAPAFLPSGYAPLIQKDIKTKTAVRGSRVTVIVSAPTGGAHGRDIRALERGSLRHPVFARGTRRQSFVRDGHTLIHGWRWVGQRVKPKMSETALKAIRPQIVRELEAELREIARDVERG